MSAEVLDLIGINNHTIIGCPSFYEPYRCNKTIVFREVDFSISSVSINAGNDVASILMKLAMDNNSYYILQGRYELPSTMFEDKDILNRHLSTRYPNASFTETDLKSFLKMYGRIFFQKSEWCNFFMNRNIGFSYGNRFHGNMAAFISGVPTLWVEYDRRVNELVEYMK